MNITSGKIAKAQKVVVYGPEGIGKSTFAAQFPNPLFIDTEGSTANMNVRRLDKPSSWQMIKDQLLYVKNNPNICKTIILDTIDWAEQLCIDFVCGQHGKSGIEDFGYGTGYTYEKEEFGKFLNFLEDIIDVGINVVLTAHAKLRKFEQPDEMGAYDRWELKLGAKTSSQISPLVKEWADMVLFVNFKTIVTQTDKDGKKFKAQGNKRVMYTAHHSCWDAKNRHDLPNECEFNYSQIAHCFTAESSVNIPIANTNTVVHTPPVIETPIDKIIDSEPVSVPNTVVQKCNISQDLPKALKDLMVANDVSDEDIRLAVSQKGYYPEDTPIMNYDDSFINGVLIGAWNQVLSMIMNNKDLPFN